VALRDPNREKVEQCYVIRYVAKGRLSFKSQKLFVIKKWHQFIFL
jgi:hypothetical protein